MAYIINDTRGQIVAVVEDGTFDTTSTDVVLIGRGITDYGDQQNTNFVWLMENFANDTAPPVPLQGQLWYNTANDTLYVRNTNDLWTGLVDLASTQAFTGQKSFVGGIIAGSSSYPNAATYSFYDGSGTATTDTAISYNSGTNSLLVNLNGITKITVSTSVTTFSTVIRPNAGLQFPDLTVQTSAGGDVFLAGQQTFSGLKYFSGGIIAGDDANPDTASYNFYDGNPYASTTSLYFRRDLNAIELALRTEVKTTWEENLTTFWDPVRFINGIRFPDNTVQTSGWNGTYNYADVFLAGAQTFTGQKTFVGGIIAGSSEYPGTASFNFYDGNSAGSTSSIFFRPDIDAIEIALYNDVKVTFFETYTEFTDTVRVIQGIKFADNTVQTTAAAAAYSLPIATTGTLGGVKPDGTSIVINSTTGVISANLTAALSSYVTLATTQILTGRKFFQGGIVAGGPAGAASFNFYDGPSGSTTSIFYRDDQQTVELALLNDVKTTWFQNLIVFWEQIRVDGGIRFLDGSVQTTAAAGGTYTLPIASTSILGGVKVDGTSIVVSPTGVLSAVGGGGGGGDANLAGTQTFTGQKSFTGGIIAGSSEYPGTASYNFYDGNSAGSTSSIFFRPDIDAIEIALYNDVKVTFFESYTEFTDRIRVIEGIRFADNTVQTTAAAGAYTLPIATTGTLGGVKPDGTSIVINPSTGVISANLTAVLTNYVTLGTGQTITGRKTFTGGIVAGSPSSLGTASFNFYDQGAGGSVGVSTSSIFFRDDQQTIEISLLDDIKTTWFQNLIVFWEQIRVDGGIRFLDGSIQTTAAVGGAYSLPIATSSILGGVKPDGTSIVINASTGVISAVGGGGGGDATLATAQTFTGQKTFIGGFRLGSAAATGQAKLSFYDGTGADNYDTYISYASDALYHVINGITPLIVAKTFVAVAAVPLKVAPSGIIFSDGSTQTSAASGGGYVLPTASTTVKGGVKIDGTSIIIDGSGVISAVGGGGAGDATLAGTQTFTGQKTFSNGFILGNAANPTKTVVNFYDGLGGDLFNTAVYYKPSDNLIAVAVQGDVIANFYTNKLSVVKQLWLSSTGVRFADGTVQTTATSNNTTGWDVTYTNVNYSIGGTFILPAGCIGIYANCEVGAISNNGGYGYIDIYTPTHVLIGSLWINGTNTRSGTDGGSGMWDSAGSFLPVPATASYVVFRFQGTATQYVTFKLLGYVLGAVTASYSLPVATASVLGGVKIGSGITVAGDGTISIGSTGYPTLGGTNTFTDTNGFTGVTTFTNVVKTLSDQYWNTAGTVKTSYVSDEIRFINDAFTPLTVRERSVLISGQDAFALQVTNSVTGTSNATALNVVATSGTVTGVTVTNTSSTLTAAPISVDAVRTSASTFDLIVANTSAGTVQETTQFVVRGDGSTFIRGSYSTAGGDYAEYFESLNGTSIPIGATVVLVEGKIRQATAQDNADDIMGVVRPKNSSCTSIIGNNPWAEWDKKYLTDDFGEYILDTHVVYEWEEEVNGATVRHSYEDWNIPNHLNVPDNAECISTDSDGNPLTHRRINPDYDPSQAYVSRQSRENWFVVGLLGQVPVRKGEPVNPRWKLMQVKTGQADLYFIR